MAIAESEIPATKIPANNLSSEEIQSGMKITEDELLRLPKDGRKWECVDGRLVEVPTDWRHDEIGGIIVAPLMGHTRGRGSETTGQAGFRMTDRSLRALDVSFSRRERVPGGGPASSTFGDLAPELCVEIISRSEEAAEMAQKAAEYFAGGAQQVWHIFPETQQA